MAETSPPAQKARPTPVTTMAPMSGSRLHSVNAVMDCAISSALNAFSFSGRLKVSVATRSDTLVRTTSSAMIHSFRLSDQSTHGDERQCSAHTVPTADSVKAPLTRQNQPLSKSALCLPRSFDTSRRQVTPWPDRLCDDFGIRSLLLSHSAAWVR